MFSRKRTALPFEPAMIISALPSVLLTNASSSSSFNLIAILPFLLIFSYSSKVVRLIIPCFVTKKAAKPAKKTTKKK